MKYFVLLLFTFLLPLTTSASTDIQQLLQLVDYIGVDYPGAVNDGEVIDHGEYGEMVDFSKATIEQAQSLDSSIQKDEIIELSRQLMVEVQAKGASDEINRLSAAIRTAVISSYDVVVIPQRKPDLRRARQLYIEYCGSCHGDHGMGDGLAGINMVPPPIAFTDKQRYRERTVYGLFNTITQGVAGTQMMAYPQLNDNDRWSLAFFTSAMAQSDELVKQGEAVYASDGISQIPLDLQKLTTTTPAQIEKSYGVEGLALMAHLRSQPDMLFNRGNASSLVFAIEKMSDSLDAYKNNEAKLAYKTAVTAYLEGFELIENSLNAVDPELRVAIEKSMTAYRNLIRDGIPAAELEIETHRIQELLKTAEEKLDRTRLSGGAAFASAMVILLREGLEALLVIAALAAFLIKTGRRDALTWLYGGVFVALLLGAVTWWASTYMIDISGMQREMTEGIAALLAAAVLFYVGFWLHNKTGAAQWKKFIESSIQKALSKSTLWGLSGLAFIAVFREILETVLFYQALWIQTENSGQSMIFSGFLVASAILAVIAWIILRYTTRLPLRQFFAVTSIFMFLMAIVFAGKGIAALQEAGKLAMDPVSLPTIDLLGIYPNLQGLLVQSVLLIFAIFMWLKSNRDNSRTR
jgi:high-affinity iron transporter